MKNRIAFVSVLMALLAACSPSKTPPSASTPSAQQDANPEVIAITRETAVETTSALRTSQTRSRRGTANPVGTLTLDSVLPRPISDPWMLRDKSQYTNDKGDRELKQRVDEALRLSEQQGLPFEGERPIDLNQDGITDGWIYYSEGTPLCYEEDIYGTGCHDRRIDLRDNREANEAESWNNKSPVPIAPGPVRIGFSEFFAGAAPAADSVALPESLQALLLECYPDAEKEFQQLSEAAFSAETLALLRRCETTIGKHFHEFEEIHRREDLAKKSKTPTGRRVIFMPFDFDDATGKEVVVGFSSKGVEAVELYQVDWQAPAERGRPLVAATLRDGKLTRLVCENQVLLHVDSQWLSIHADARARIAETHLLPAFAGYRSGRWYESLQLFRTGLILAALLGDVEIQEGAESPMQISSRALERWEFDVGQYQAGAVLQVAHSLVWQTGMDELSDGLVALAESSVRHQDFSDALELYRLILRFADKFHTTIDRVNALQDMATLYNRLGNLDRAIDCLFQSLDLESSLGYIVEIANNLRLLQDSPQSNLVNERAIRSHAIAVNRGCKLARIAAMYADLGEPEKASTYFAEAERIINSLGHQYAQADLLNLRAQWDLREGRGELAIQRLHRALELANQPEEDGVQERRGKRSQPVSPMSRYLFRIHRTRELDVVGMESEHPPATYRALSAGLLGEAYLQQASDSTGNLTGDLTATHLEEAERWCKEAYQLYDSVDDAVGKTVSTLRLAAVAHRRAQSAKTLELAEQAEQLARSHNVFEVTWRALALQAALHQQENRPDRAEALYLQAVGEIESLRAAMRSEPARVAFFGSKLDVYESLVALYARQNDHERAWNFMERAKARTLLDVLGVQEFRPQRAVTAQSADELPNLFTPTRPESDGKSPLSAPRQSIELGSLADRATGDGPAASRTIHPVALATFQESLGRRDLVVEYFVTEQELFAAVLSRDSIEVRRIARSRATLRDDVEQFRTIIQDPTKSYESLAKQLFQDLLAPCLTGIRDAEHLIILPSESLHYLPFQALMLPDGRFVVQRYELSYSPSASGLYYALNRRDQSTSTGGLVVAADPKVSSELDPLPYAFLEGQRIFNMAQDPKKFFGGPEAKESSIVGAMESARLFHFAGHCDLRSTNPLGTALLLTEDSDHDGRLEVRELFGLDLHRCGLAVLSACDTQLGRFSRGDELVGMTRAFLRAGVPTVVASLWKVPDESTFRIMVRFHERLGATGTSRISALVGAQRDFLATRLQETQLTESERVLLASHQAESSGMSRRGAGAPKRSPRMASGAVPHPYYWAAFQLTGDWR